MKIQLVHPQPLDPQFPPYIAEVFGERGFLAQNAPDYSIRQGQIELASAIDCAMAENRSLLGDAPCGIGKSYAYLVPTIEHLLRTGEHAVIVTANIALQEQLVTKDLPALAQVLPHEFSFKLLKGRRNYACQHVCDGMRRIVNSAELKFQDKAHRKLLKHVLAWATKSKTGDRSELDITVPDLVWQRASSTSDDCLGDLCICRKSCFHELARQAARQADIVVTNYHLWFAHLMLRRSSGKAQILSPFRYAVLDEAHDAAEIARDFMGFSASLYGVRQIGYKAQNAGVVERADALFDAAEAFFGKVATFKQSSLYYIRLKKPHFVDCKQLVKELDEIAAIASETSENEDVDSNTRGKALVVARHANKASDNISEATQQSDPNKVYWIEINTKDNVFLRAKPINVANDIRASLFDWRPRDAEGNLLPKPPLTVAMVSATLATGGTPNQKGRFNFIRREFGVPDDTLELAAKSPFDFEQQALLVVPNIPWPNKDPDAWRDAAVKVIRRTIELCKGRTLILTTSNSNKDHLRSRLQDIPYRLLCQGELERTQLAKIFKEDVTSVLIGTKSFWQGIDVPGEALTAVIIDRLPFTPPDDPLYNAIPSPFMNYSVPRATIQLRQGAGRLVRRIQDVGVVVILDARLTGAHYGSGDDLHRGIIHDLGFPNGTDNIEDIAEFLRKRERR